VTQPCGQAVVKEGKNRERNPLSASRGSGQDEASVNYCWSRICLTPDGRYSREFAGIAQGNFGANVYVWTWAEDPVQASSLRSANPSLLYHWFSISRLTLLLPRSPEVARESVPTQAWEAGPGTREVAGTWKDLIPRFVETRWRANLTGQVRNIGRGGDRGGDGDLARKITVDVPRRILQPRGPSTHGDQLAILCFEVTRVARVGRQNPENSVDKRWCRVWSGTVEESHRLGQCDGWKILRPGAYDRRVTTAVAPATCRAKITVLDVKGRKSIPRLKHTH